MAKSTRLKKVEHNLTVKQIVLLQIQESRQYPSMIAHARALVATGCIPAETLCDRIVAAIELAHKGLPVAAKNRLIRAALRDGLFLGRLAQECSTRLLSHSKERRLEVALLYAWAVNCVRDSDEDRVTEKLKPWFEFGNALLLSMQGDLEAVRLIERAFFDGTKILYIQAEEEFVGGILEVRALLDKLSGAGIGDPGAAANKRKGTRRRLEGTPSPTDCAGVSLGARREAESLILAARIKVLDEFNETREAAKLLTRHMNSYGM